MNPHWSPKLYTISYYGCMKWNIVSKKTEIDIIKEMQGQWHLLLISYFNPNQPISILLQIFSRFGNNPNNICHIKNSINEPKTSKIHSYNILSIKLIPKNVDWSSFSLLDISVNFLKENTFAGKPACLTSYISVLKFITSL